MNWWKLTCFLSWLPAWQIFFPPWLRNIFFTPFLDKPSFWRFLEHFHHSFFISDIWTAKHWNHLNDHKTGWSQNPFLLVSVAFLGHKLLLLFLIAPSPPLCLTFLWDEKKSQARAHLHAQRLGSSCERGIEMEIGGERKSRLRFANVCAASWLAHQLSKGRGGGVGVDGWV